MMHSGCCILLSISRMANESTDFKAEFLRRDVWMEVRYKPVSSGYWIKRSPDKTTIEQRRQIEINEEIHVLLKCAWQFPDDGWWALNNDCTLNDMNEAGWGVAIRDSVGQVVAATHGSSPHTSINQIELSAMERGIELALARGCTKLLLQSDFMNAIRYQGGGYLIEYEENGEANQVHGGNASLVQSYSCI